MIIIARQLQQKCREQNQPLYMVLIDLTKAFDIVNLSGPLAGPGKNWLARKIYPSAVDAAQHDDKTKRNPIGMTQAGMCHCSSSSL